MEEQSGRLEWTAVKYNLTVYCGATHYNPYSAALK